MRFSKWSYRVAVAVCLVGGTNTKASRSRGGETTCDSQAENCPSQVKLFL